MKKIFVIFFAICSTLFFDVLSFNIGYERFAQVAPDPGMTRSEWYKKNIEKHEKKLKDTIVAKLKISDVEWADCHKKAQKSVLEIEEEIKRLAKDIRGNWIADYSTGLIYKDDDWLSQKKLDTVSFDIDDEKINKIKNILRDFGYSGEIITLYPEAGESLIAYQNLITIRPDLFLYDSADQAFRLRHELSHVIHQDIVFERTIKNCVQRFFRDDFDPSIHESAEDTFDLQKLKQKNVTLDDIDQVYDLLMNKWWNFHEYRADLESVFAMKNNNEFREKIKDLPQYDGYPLNYQYRTAYEAHAPVPYVQDFLEGLRNDLERAKNLKTDLETLRYQCRKFNKKL